VGSDKKAAFASANIKRSFTFYVNPEWKGPEADHDDPEMWTWQGDESMHPYWSIRRLTQQRLREATFNMKTTQLTFNAITVGAPCGVSTTLAMDVTVPFLTNSVQIPQGGELLLEDEDKPRKVQQKPKTWKDDVQIRSRGGGGSGGLLAGATRKATKPVVDV